MAKVATNSTRSVQVLTYNGKAFVTGLLWHPLSTPTGYMREARQFGRQENMDIVAIRHTEQVIQAGFVSRSAGAVKGMFSLASALAGQLGGSWIAAWRVSPDEDRYALVAVHEGAVIPGSDLVGSAEEIQKKLMQQLSRPITFKKTYLPAEFGRGGEELDVATLLIPENLRREHRLKPLAFGLSPAELVRLSAISVLVICALIGWQQWEAHKARLAREAAIAAEQRRIAELQALNLRSHTEQTLKALEHPWSKQPGVSEFITGCNGAIDSLRPSIAGWPFTSAQCDGENAVATYQRTGNSTADDFIAATQGHFQDAPVFSNDESSATVKIGMKLGLAGDSALEAANEVITHLNSWFHSQNLQPSIKEISIPTAQPVALPGQQAPVAFAPPDWKHFELSYSSSIPPSIVLYGVPESGLRLREIKTVLQGDHLNWSVIGDIYAK